MLLRADTDASLRSHSDQNRLCHFDLASDPGIGLFQTLAQGSRRAPAQLLKDQFIVRVASSNPKRTLDMTNTHLLAGGLHHQLRELVDGNHLFRSDIYGASKIGFHKAPNTFD